MKRKLDKSNKNAQKLFCAISKMHITNSLPEEEMSIEVYKMKLIRICKNFNSKENLQLHYLSLIYLLVYSASMHQNIISQCLLSPKTVFSL